MANFALYRARMEAADPTISDIIDLGDGTCFMVKRLMFHWTLIRTDIGDYDGYDPANRWCYATRERAVLAVTDWRASPAPPSREPYGWHRHPHTGRRRPNGHQELEYVEM